MTFALCCISINAQKFLDGLRAAEPGKGVVVVEQAPEIDSLVNGITRQQPVQRTVAHPQQGAGNAADNSKADNSAPASPVAATPSSPGTSDLDVSVVDTRKKVMRNSYKMQGYRIQVFSGGNSRIDRQKAETAGAQMKANFPTEPIYVHFYSPSWKCRMGNYKTAEEARTILAKVKKLGYPQACIVKGTISVQY